MSVTWDGVNAKGVEQAYVDKNKDILANATFKGDWTAVLKFLDEHGSLINSTRPGSRSGFVPLHQAAYLGAPAAVAESLIEKGAWRSLRDLEGDRPVDIARRNKRDANLVALLEPVNHHNIPQEVVVKLEEYLHQAMHNWPIMEKANFRLPQVSVLMELSSGTLSVPTPGLFGGWQVSILCDGEDAKLKATMSSRMAGSATYEISKTGINEIGREYM
mmetsp:Transcript_414/g.484  ORF Transcript_414/g.484 Transcript_414/m.484 type:complete len:217 (-) Transcript_414:469-1119(-)|eukprot:CAMPEP_0204828750 /NCGR_PEP_ID=MMETSP1346-20131115/6660_1 /ASSEMBLY_ACC=CAM_ASM_000771 /TAXON_ID=215587 /ORGANISM="Aplanochytrium stocchinoi, Strain GSBS06" /LENGTH=216 /DNA_ID=CAMNT_0051958053 /DNA_START=107 /DNA_END=757 /DNA_ORIENTATION=-